MTVKRIVLLLVLGLLSYLTFLLVNFPAAQAYAWFGKHLPVQAYGISGTIWSGQITVAQLQDQRLESLQWQLQPSRLLMARLVGQVQGTLGQGRISAQVNAGRNDIELRNVRVDMPATELVQLAGIRVPTRLEGRFDVSLREARLNEGRLTHADGIVTWQQGVVHLLGRPLPLGNMNLRLEPAGDGEIRGTLISDGGPLDASGDLRILANGQLNMDLTVRAREGAVGDAEPAMRMLGIPRDGTPVRARLTGSLDGSTPMQLSPAG